MYLETGKKICIHHQRDLRIFHLQGFCDESQAISPLAFCCSLHQESLCAQGDTPCWVCQVAQPGQRHQSDQSKPGQQQGLGTVLQKIWQAPAQGTAPVSDEATGRKSSASERKDASLPTKGNAHFAVVTTALCGCKTRSSYTCQGKYFSCSHGCCSCTLAAVK